MTTNWLALIDVVDEIVGKEFRPAIVRFASSCSL